VPAPMDSPLLVAARQWYDAGYCVIPSHEDGGKRPFGKWKEYQHKRPEWTEVEGWLRTGKYTGIGVLCGEASGNAELLEIEGPMPEAVSRLQRLIARAGEFKSIGAHDLLAEVARGCVEQSAGGGLHFFIRVIDGPAKPNTRLAYVGSKPDRKVVAETRGEGGFVIVAPTPGRNGHEPGASYLFINGGSPERTVSVSSDDRDVLHMMMYVALNEDPDHSLTDEEPDNTVPTSHDATSTFDDYRGRVTWRDILEPAGWTWSHRDGERDYWTRPGKKVKDGISASTIEDGPMFNFSANADLPEERGLSKAQVYAHLHHGGDLSAAARALREAGYGAGITYADLPAWTIPEPEVGVDEDGVIEDDPYTRLVKQKFSELRIMEDARTMLAASKVGEAPPLTALDLEQLLAQPDEEARYRVDTLWPSEGRVMLAAAAKSGKTTMVAANLIPALVDGRPFLGRFDVQPIQGRVVLLNMEVGDATLRRWMRDCHVDRPRQVVVANLRGKASALTLASPSGRKRFASFLRANDAEVVILDPLAPVLASLGLNEDKNAEVAAFFAHWSEVMDLAGVSDDMIVHHTGHAGQRSRGASRLLDEPDAIWTLTKDAEEDDPDGFSSMTPTRYLAAYGRDVELPMESLAFDMATRSLTLTGKGKAAAGASKVEAKVITLMSDGKARTASGICKEIPGAQNSVWKAVQTLRSSGLLQVVGKQRNGDLLVLPEVPQ
jgi:rhodanese-related sulfurtransferase